MDFQNVKLSRHGSTGVHFGDDSPVISHKLTQTFSYLNRVYFLTVTIINIVTMHSIS